MENSLLHSSLLPNLKHISVDVTNSNVNCELLRVRVVIFALLEDLETNISRTASNIKHSEWEHFIGELILVVEHSSLFNRSNLLNEVVFPNSVDT